MNRFLDPSGKVYWAAPKRAYARLEIAEPMGANEEEERFAIYSAVSADRLDVGDSADLQEVYDTERHLL